MGFPFPYNGGIIGPGDRDSISSSVSEEAFESDGRRVLGVLARLAWSVPAEVATPLAEKLLEMLLDLVARPETSAALVGALHMLCFAKVTRSISPPPPPSLPLWLLRVLHSFFLILRRIGTNKA